MEPEDQKNENDASLRELLIKMNTQLEEQSREIASLKHANQVTPPTAEPTRTAPLIPEGTAFASPVPPTPPTPPAPPVYTEKKAEQPTPAAHSASFEEKLGMKWFSVAGIVVLILGISFFLKYAFDNDWIGETGRVIIGIAIGVGLLGLGEKLIRQYPRYAYLLTGGGIVILYLSFFAAYQFYHLLPVWAAYGAFTLVTASGMALAIRYDAQLILVLASAGGFMTPILISSGENHPVALFSYILILDIAILIVSFFKSWYRLNVLGSIATVFIYLAWSGQFYSDSQLLVALTFMTLFFILYSVSFLAYRIRSKTETKAGLNEPLTADRALTLLLPLIYFVGVWSLLWVEYRPFMGYFTALLGLYYFLFAYAAKAFSPNDSTLRALLSFLSIGFLTLAIPIEFRGNVITLAWIVEMFVIFAYGIYTRHQAILQFGLLVAALTFLRLIIIEPFHIDPGSSAIFNGRFLTYLFAVGVLFLLGYLAQRGLDSTEDLRWKATISSYIVLFFFTANFFAVSAGSMEIDYYYDTRISAVDATTASLGYTADYDPGRAAREELRSLQSWASVTLSLFWIAYAIVLLAFGMLRKSRWPRIGGLLLLVFALLKLFFHDLWSLGPLYRIISSIVLGIVLLSISFLYTRYRERFREII
ncbi:MAG: DUF2339 domain-containing protein [Candidatus Moraniibacteriota bacterium]|nr:MAG: DUF2339 domain-containing protein [Candidatus Moranbacteria bacterium]